MIIMMVMVMVPVVLVRVHGDADGYCDGDEHAGGADISGDAEYDCAVCGNIAAPIMWMAVMMMLMMMVMMTMTMVVIRAPIPWMAMMMMLMMLMMMLSDDNGGGVEHDDADGDDNYDYCDVEHEYTDGDDN